MLPRDTAPARTPGWEKARWMFVEKYAGTEAASRGEPNTVQRRESFRQVVERKVLDPTALTYEAALRYGWHNNVDGYWDPESCGKARDLLVAASTEGQGLHRRKALAVLASIYCYLRSNPRRSTLEGAGPVPNRIRGSHRCPREDRRRVEHQAADQSLDRIAIGQRAYAVKFAISRSTRSRTSTCSGQVRIQSV